MKHAFLIMAHNEPYILQVLISKLTGLGDDVYVHIDKKVKPDVYEQLKTATITGGGKIVEPRIDVRWGDYSLIACELALFKNASATPHDFYHLLSGVDLPLKPISEIHDFFDQHKDKLFVYLTPDTEHHRKRIGYCINYYHFFMHFSRSWIGKIIGHLHIPWLFIVFQKMLGVSRMKNDGTFKMCKGHNWMSLPEDAVRYLINQEDYIKHRFRYTCCADEIFALSIFMNSPFKSRFYQENENECRNGALREIDWQRGNPYTWTMEDLQLLQKSNNLFARKFSTKKDKEIIDYIKENV